jgi:hypothetical protein
MERLRLEKLSGNHSAVGVVSFQLGVVVVAIFKYEVIVR